jgi:hypothetical protein
MSDEARLPRRVVLLGEALRPVWLESVAQLAGPVEPAIPAGGMIEIAAQHLSALRIIGARVVHRVNDLMPAVVANEQASDAEIFRAAGRLEAAIDDLLMGYRDVRLLRVDPREDQARDLLAALYRHTADEVCSWLGELVETLADPLAAARRRGLPTAGVVELPLRLTLSVAPELAELSHWIEQRAEAIVQGTRRRKSGRPGFWCTVAAALVGVGIGATLFGDDG